ncbi:class I SAM-dependent methyltransferase [Mycobacterium sp.]|jgi:ubiquinone/menaquinone biosynthesis C-methylase UbiE|uniref:class I SAM-dependent methyltransferase n=1 Tax=Mycobacterium sp. TaxID=1785 RepID=UPI002D2E6B6E|nr:class I SAM-dependent methyltransferase [Mycobacterium sp.]HZA09733.1 class I SAM-dependent methyltransferase [Mycobacterium sp.]
MTAPSPTTADHELAAKHRAMWATGDYAKLAADLVAPLGPVLVQAGAVGPGDRVLDVAAGTGNASIPAAQAGANVVASDLTPELLQRGQAIAAEKGVELQWREANAEALPFADDEFDAVLSCIGVMFAPHHQRAADELVRVCRPGGTIAVLSWTPEGFIGRLFATMKPYVAAPPPGAQPPPLWGSEQHVRELFGQRVSDLTAQRRTLTVDIFSSGEQWRDYFKSYYGPTIAAYRNIAADPDRVAELDRELADLAGGHLDGSRMEWEYLLVTARRR